MRKPSAEARRAIPGTEGTLGFATNVSRFASAFSLSSIAFCQAANFVFR
jgi:hypothetical protein